MALLKKRKGQWYVSVLWCKENATRQTEKQIALKTDSKVTAHKRIAEVSKVEDDIKQGMDFSFP